MENKIKNYIVYRPDAISIRYALLAPYKLTDDLDIVLEVTHARDLERIYTSYPKARNYPIVEYSEWLKSDRYLK